MPPLAQKARDDFRAELLQKTHDRAAFTCGVEALDNYLKKRASQDAARHAAVCFVLTPDGKKVAGFYTLSQYAMDLVQLPSEIAARLPRYPEVPATLLGRLAIDREFRSLKLGEFLLLDVLHRSWRQSHQVASAVLIVDAKDAAAKGFYEHYGFLPLPAMPGRLFLPMKTIGKLFGAAGKRRSCVCAPRPQPYMSQRT